MVSDKDGIGCSVTFIGGILADEQRELIVKASLGPIQNAADALQKGILKGLHEAGIADIKIVNLPFVGTYPKNYCEAGVARFDGKFDSARIIGPAFSTRPVLRLVSRFAGVLAGLRIARAHKGVIVIYSAHLPFLFAALVYRLFHQQCRLCLVLPDLPEFMGGGGQFYRFAKSIDARLFYWSIQYVDRFVLLAMAMADRLRVSCDRFIVVEGIASLSEDLAHVQAAVPRSFLYSGTLDRRYGIQDMLSAAKKISQQDVQFKICGDGDAKDDVLAACRDDNRIIYLGQLSREEVAIVQRNSTILVNPRRPEGEFTQYSFPSKTLEYLASGRPVLMHKLAGVPDEYYRYVETPEMPDADGLALAMSKMLKMSDQQLDAIGMAGREFVVKNKDPRAQGLKIAKFLSRLSES